LEITYPVRRLALIMMLIVFATMAAAGCSDPEPIERAAQSPDATDADERTREPAVFATTSGGLAEREATVGVASTTEETETEKSEDSSSSADAAAPADSPQEKFIASPQASGGAGYGADGIVEVRYGVHEDYERVVIDLGTGEEPAWSVPEWTLSSPAGDGILRITLPSVSSTGVSDGKFDGPLLKDFHVVRAPGGGMFVDIFAESAFTYRVIELSNPGRIAVDFKPSNATLDYPLPAQASKTVLAQPRSGARVGGSLTVSGYSRNPEATNTITLTDAQGETLVRETVMSNDWTSTWGYFETTLDVPPFSGEGTLKVGAQSARDGSFEGVQIPVFGG
jgi:hypothetical protein